MNTTGTENTPTEDLLSLYHEAIYIRDSYQARANELKEILAERHPEGGSFGDHKITIKAGPSRINEARLKEAFPPSENPQLYVLKADTKKVRDAISADMLAPFLDAGKPSVVIS